MQFDIIFFIIVGQWFHFLSLWDQRLYWPVLGELENTNLLFMCKYVWYILFLYSDLPIISLELLISIPDFLYFVFHFKLQLKH